MSRFGSSGGNKSARKAARRVLLQLESLEDRIVPSNSPLSSPSPSPAASASPTTSPPPASPPTTYTVGASDVATLIKDINIANAQSTQSNQAITINLTASTYEFEKADNNTSGPNALPVITGNIIIQGNGAVLQRDPSFQQSTPFRFFDVAGASTTSTSGGQSTTTPAGSLTLDNVTLQGGLEVGSGSDGTIGGGGAILNQGNLNLNGVTVDNSSATGSNSTGTSTSGATFGGGAIANLYGTTMLVNCTLVSNMATGGQGGGYGGAIFNVDGTVNVSSCTLATNSANTGGAIYNYGTKTATGTAPTATVTLSNSILADSIGSNDLVNDESSGGAAVVNTGSNNIVMTMSNLDNATINGTSTAANPLLGLLSYNGGLTPTMLLQSGSPALGGGSGSNTPTIDQRGLARGPVVDIGATQETLATAIATSLALASSVSGTGSITLTATVSGNATATQGGIVEFKDAKTNMDMSIPVTNGQATLTTNQTNPGDTITASYTNTSGTAGPSTATYTIPGSPANGSTGNNTPAGGTTNNTSLANSFLALMDSFLPQLSGLLSIPVLGTTTTGGTTSTSGNPSGTGGSSTTIGGSSTSVGNSGTPVGLVNPLVGSGTPTAQIPTQISSWLNQVWTALFPNSTIDSTSLNKYASMLQSGAPPSTVIQAMQKDNNFSASEIQAAYKYLKVTPTGTDEQFLLYLMNNGAPFQDILALIAGSDAYYQAHGSNNTTFLKALYKDLLYAPDVDQNSLTTLGNLINAGVPRWAVAMSIVSSQPFLTELVLLDYSNYLPSQLVDPNTLTNIIPFYVGQLSQGKITNEQVITDLLSSLYKGPGVGSLPI